MRRVKSASAVFLPAVLLGACVGGGGSVRTASVPSSVVTVAPVMTMSAAAYVAAASSIDLFAIRSAQLALQRAQSPASRAFAERTLRAHQGTSAQLSFAGRRLNLLPVASLNPQQQSMLDALQSTPDFDSTYRAQQAMILSEGVALHGNYATAGDSPTLRPIARNAESVMRANLTALRRSR